MTAATDTPPISLPGYSLTTRLGSGGYGEVWLALAPGGLTKAVKFIYGDYRGKRAELELKSLQRIKEVRHPFLLSLERIEVVENRLVIVTELAESSLKDRFDACREGGQPGVPREELLGYLRDAADALDFLGYRHSLQHLDVKPENLLLIGGHVKVADFGLVKDVNQSQASLVGGLTPLYSAPEVFQGAPTRFSDQYSLAVLYVEMLTGVPPFEGATPAELTMQHLHDEPEFNHVPLADRYVLARALAKDPLQRFPTCREMVQALAGQGNSQAGFSHVVASPPSVASTFAAGELSDQGSAGGASAKVADRPQPKRPGAVTQEFDDQLCQGHRVVSKSMLVEIQPPPHRGVEQHPPVALESVEFRPRPMLLIGIGGAAASVLQHFRASILRKYGNRSEIPAIQLLLIDSDPRTIHAATSGASEAALRPDETLALPLRRPQEYRERSADLTQWLSRRWLYNIPKTLRTEGLRPLGRLAFADHARRIVQRIRIAISAALAPESLAASNQVLNLPFQENAIDIRVVASIAGGTGSGMSLDIGYAVRSALQKLPGLDATSVGVLLYSTGCSARHHDLARVNAFSWLTEYNHFNRPGGIYPGDACCGLNAQPESVKSFDSAYLIDLGQGLEEQEFSAATESVANYLALDALTNARRFFDQCRAEPSRTATDFAPLRTFSLQHLPAATEETIALAAKELRRCVVMLWAGDEGGKTEPKVAAESTFSNDGLTGRDTNQIVRGVAQMIGRMQLQVEGLATNARELLEGQFSTDLDATAQALWSQVNKSGKEVSLADVRRTIETLFAGPDDAHGQGSVYFQKRPLETIFRALLMKIGNDLSQWILDKLDDRGERLTGAKHSAKWLIDHFDCVERDADRLAVGLVRRLDDLASSTPPATTATRDSRNVDADLVKKCLRLRIDQAAVQGAALLARRLKLEMSNIQGALTEFGRHLRHMAESLAPGTSPESADAYDQAVALLGACKEELVLAADEKLHAYVEEQGGLFQTVMGNTRMRSQMLEELNRQTLDLVRRTAPQVNAIDTLLAADEEGNPMKDLSAFGEKTIPRFLKQGGSLRRLAVLPATEPRSATGIELKERLTREATIVCSPSTELTLCSEAWDISLPHLAYSLIDNRRDYADFASRVQTRSDIAWSPLIASVVSAGGLP